MPIAKLPLRFVAIDSALACAWRTGTLDANGQPAQHLISDGHGNPCRHCLDDIARNAPMLVLAHRPFPSPQPYAELGPIFVHAEHCPRYDETAGAPAMFLRRDSILLRGYDADDRIVYGAGKVIPTIAIDSAARRFFERDDVAYIHLRSASNNGYQCRIERG